MNLILTCNVYTLSNFLNFKDWGWSDSWQILWTQTLLSGKICDKRFLDRVINLIPDSGSKALWSLIPFFWALSPFLWALIPVIFWALSPEPIYHVTTPYNTPSDVSHKSCKIKPWHLQQYFQMTLIMDPQDGHLWGWKSVSV